MFTGDFAPRNMREGRRRTAPCMACGAPRQHRLSHECEMGFLCEGGKVPLHGKWPVHGYKYCPGCGVYDEETGEYSNLEYEQEEAPHGEQLEEAAL